MPKENEPETISNILVVDQKNDKMDNNKNQKKKKPAKKNKKASSGHTSNKTASLPAHADASTISRVTLAQANTQPSMSTPKRKLSPNSKLFDINISQTPEKRIKLATPGIFEKFSRFCTICKEHISTKNHLLTECTGIPLTPTSRPISQHAANRRSLTRLKRALKMSTKIDFG